MSTFRRLRDRLRPQSIAGQIALLVIGIHSIKNFCHHGAKHGIAEKFKALVAGGIIQAGMS